MLGETTLSSNRDRVKFLTLDQQEAIYNHYGVELFIVMCSPLREDNKPSFSTYESNGLIRWKDFAYGGGNIYDFVMEYESVSYNECLKIIQDILDNGESPQGKAMKQKINVTRDVIPKQNFEKYELEYWATRGIDKRQLLSEKVLPLKMLLINGKFKCTSVPDNPKFIYYYTKESWKVYSPYDQEHKWVSNNINLIPYESQPQGKNKDLIILSSKKDKMVFDNLNLPFDTTSVLAEGNFSGVIYELDKSLAGYENIYALLDFDKSDDPKTFKGVERTKQMEVESKGRIKGIYLPEQLSEHFAKIFVKDIDEIYTKLGSDILYKTINKILI